MKSTPYILMPPLFLKQFWQSTAFLLTSFLLGGLWFTVLTSILKIGENLFIVGIGIPIFLMFPFIVKAAANVERSRLLRFLNVQIESHYQPLPTDGWWHRALVFISDPALWRDTVYIFLLFPLGILDIIVLIVIFFVPIGLLIIPFFFQWISDIPFLQFLSPDSWIKSIIIAIIAILWVWIGSYLVDPIARLHNLCARNLLGVPLSVRLAILARSRTQILGAAMNERQRIAHDLHDGAQQHLIALAMDLGMAKEKFKTDPEMARSLIIKAHEQAKRSLAELRDLVRGIYPAILTDRGLDAALSALASRSPIPVTVNVHFKERLPELIEATAYFIVAEALTNIAKHSNASESVVTIFQEENNLVIEVSDNGQGGASADQGTGLLGLRDRLAIFEGTLSIESPPGGPTCLRGVLPCVL
jgi:signal transduction histidine kinase